MEACNSFSQKESCLLHIPFCWYIYLKYFTKRADTILLMLQIDRERMIRGVRMISTLLKVSRHASGKPESVTLVQYLVASAAFQGILTICRFIYRETLGL